MIRYIENITIRDLNPHNGFLGSDYQDNLWGCGISLLPGLANFASGIKVVRAFESEDYIKKNVLKEGEHFNWACRKYSRGLAVKLTWDNFTFESALAFCHAVLDDYAEKCHCIINTTEKTVEIFRRMRDQCIKEISEDSIKKIRLSN